MNADHFHINRPVHLARRDVFFEEAKRLIRQLPATKPPEEQKQTTDKALFMLLEAYSHAAAANRSEKTSEQDRLFLEFLQCTIDNTQSIARMLRRRAGVQSENSSLLDFLGSSETRSKMSSHYKRCAAHILKGLLHILEKADEPYEILRQNSLSKMSATDKARYQKARLHHKEETHSVAERGMAHASSPCQISG